jgi:hypothetical protein
VIKLEGEEGRAYLDIPSFFMPSLAMPCLDMPSFDMPSLLMEPLAVLGFCVPPVPVCEPVLLASFTLGDLAPVCGVVAGVWADAPNVLKAVNAAKHVVINIVFFISRLLFEVAWGE